jgi:hypothetical protein
MEETRKLAHIEKIEWIREIPGADKICTYGILGWEVVDQKGKYNVGDKVVYCEIDSVLPDKPEYEFLRDRKFRIRTIKLKGQVSQGLVLPIYPVLVGKSFPGEPRFEIGTDVTENLGITKYLTPSEREEIKKVEVNQNKLTKFMKRYSWYRRLFLTRKQKEGFPYWVSKTDEERIQNIPHVLEQFKDKEVYVTEKIDYQSVTFTGKMVPKFGGLFGKLFPIKKYQFVVCSRNMTTNDKNSLYWKIAKKYNIEQILKENPTLTIQGEQGDTNIQGNKYGITEPKLWIFNIIDHERNYHYDWKELSEFCKKHNLNTVPLIEPYTFTKSNKFYKFPTLSVLGLTVYELVEFSKGKSVLADIPREGIVVRCIENGKKLLSFKVINPDFLLKYND